jgi:hypothetical protein
VNRGCSRPPSRARRVSRTGAGGTASRDWHRPRRTVRPHSDGDGLPPGELVRRHRGASPGCMMVPSRRCQGVKCPRTGAGARARSALERGGPRSRAGRTLERGGPRSREMHPLERGGARSGEARILERGGTYPRGSSSGPPGGPLGPSWHGPCPAWLSKAYLALALLRVLSGDFPAI